MKARKKPVVVEVEQLTWENWGGMFAILSRYLGAMMEYMEFIQMMVCRVIQVSALD